MAVPRPCTADATAGLPDLVFPLQLGKSYQIGYQPLQLRDTVYGLCQQLVLLILIVKLREALVRAHVMTCPRTTVMIVLSSQPS